jgi:MSHA biogenesis protein MshL
MVTNNTHTIMRASLGVLLSLSVLVGCQHYKPTEETPAEKEMALLQKEQQKAAIVSVPEAVNEALLNGGNRPASRSPRDERFDVSVNNVPARTFFLSLIADAGVNVVAHPEVSGTISLELKDVTIEDVLNVTREIYGYEYGYQNGIYTIFPRKLRTETFAIDYIDVQRVGVSDTSVLVGKIGSNNNGNNRNSGNSSGQSQDDSANLLGMVGGEKNSGAGGEGISPGSRVQTLNRTDFWGTLETTIAAIVGQGEGRMVMVNPQAGMVVVKALPRELSEVRRFLERSELSVKRQVILETKILEVRLSEGYETGINWSTIQGQLLLAQDVAAFESPVNIVEASNAVGEVFSSIFKVADISDLLSLLQTQGNVQVLSSPRVSTVNNQKAVIRVGSDEFFVTGISSSQTSNIASTTSTPNIELSSFFSGISLDVTPQISESGEVILHIHPIVSDVQDQLKTFTVGDENFSLPLALREIRESDSIVRARSGEVVVLGGLMQESMRVREGKQPGLGDVPLLNRLFQTKARQSSKTELVILMRPVVVDSDAWERDLEGSGGRVRALGDEFRNRY